MMDLSAARTELILVNNACIFFAPCKDRDLWQNNFSCAPPGQNCLSWKSNGFVEPQQNLFEPHLNFLFANNGHHTILTDVVNWFAPMCHQWHHDFALTFSNWDIRQFLTKSHCQRMFWVIWHVHFDKCATIVFSHLGFMLNKVFWISFFCCAFMCEHTIGVGQFSCQTVGALCMLLPLADHEKVSWFADLLIISSATTRSCELDLKFFGSVVLSFAHMVQFLAADVLDVLIGLPCQILSLMNMLWLRGCPNAPTLALQIDKSHNWGLHATSNSLLFPREANATHLCVNDFWFTGHEKVAKQCR